MISWHSRVSTVDPKKGCKMSEDMGGDDTMGTEGREFPLPPNAAPGATEDAARRRSPLTIVVAAFVAAVVLMASGIGIGWVLSRDSARGGAVGRGPCRPAVASGAEAGRVPDLK